MRNAEILAAILGWPLRDVDGVPLITSVSMAINIPGEIIANAGRDEMIILSLVAQNTKRRWDAGK